MVGRAGVLLMAALSLAIAGWLAVRARGSVTPSPEAPVTVGSVRVPAADLEAAAAFDAFHARWRARTRCLASYRDPYDDRCGDAPRPAVATCRWMGEATVCRNVSFTTALRTCSASGCRTSRGRRRA